MCRWLAGHAATPGALVGDAACGLYHIGGTLLFVARVQVTVDPELEAALSEFGAGAPRSKAIRDLAVSGAEALRTDRERRGEALEALRRIAVGEDQGFDPAVSEALHRERA